MIILEPVVHPTIPDALRPKPEGDFIIYEDWHAHDDDDDGSCDSDDDDDNDDDDLISIFISLTFPPMNGKWTSLMPMMMIPISWTPLQSAP